MDFSDFGITRNHLKQSLMHSAAITAAGLVVITLMGVYTGSWATRNLSPAYVFYYVFLSVPVQELFFRGFVQTRLEKKIRPWAAVVVASVLFGAVHFYNPLLAGLALAAGLAWGYSFHIRKCLAGPVLSHTVLGLCLFLFVL